MRFPTITSEWIRIVEYRNNHLNDFCLFQDLSDTWHCVGIMGTGTWDSEQSFFHSAGKSLLEPFEHRPPILAEAPPAHMASQKHAPFVVVENSIYHLFYRRPPGTVLCVRSRNPDVWPGLGDVVFERRDARDICIVKIGGIYHMYYCQSELVDGTPRSAILLRRSRDLKTWEAPAAVHVDTNRAARHSYLESPFLVEGPDGFYLFIRHRLFNDPPVTVVLYSDVAYDFPSGEYEWFCELEDVHAPEIVKHGSELYIARVSGPPHASTRGSVHEGWIEVARMSFA